MGSRIRLASIMFRRPSRLVFTYDFAGQPYSAGGIRWGCLNLTQTFGTRRPYQRGVCESQRRRPVKYSVAGRSTDDHIAAMHANGQIEYGLRDTLNKHRPPLSIKAGCSRGGFLRTLRRNNFSRHCIPISVHWQNALWRRRLLLPRKVLQFNHRAVRQRGSIWLLSGLQLLSIRIERPRQFRRSKWFN